MLMKKILLFFVTIMLSAGLGFAQSRNITGKVRVRGKTLCLG